MKKIIPILMLVCLLGSFAACGQQEEAVAIITPEPVSSQTVEQGEQAQVVVPDVAPADQGGQTANADSADSDQDRRNDSGSSTTTYTNTNTNTNTDNTDNGGDTDNSVDKLAVAQGYVGSSLGALQSVIGAPNSSEYVVSCLDDGLMDGILYYDGFIVWTVQYTDGSEVVKGVS